MPKSDATLQWLCQAVVEIWEEFEEDLLERLVESMTSRLTAVIRARGWYTKY